MESFGNLPYEEINNMGYVQNINVNLKLTKVKLCVFFFHNILLFVKITHEN